MDKQVHIILIDDDINTEVDLARVRQNLPDTEIVLVKNTAPAIAQLEEWKKVGISADIIVSDLGLMGYGRGEDEYGYQVLDKIDKWYRSQPSSQAPTLFLQSKDYKVIRNEDIYKETMSGTPCTIISSYEWNDIEDGKLTGIATRAHSNALREHIAGLLVQKKKPEPFRYLLVDDDITTSIRDLRDVFKNLGANAEFVIAHSYREAIETLDMWAQDGKRSNVVDLDYYVPYGHVDVDEYPPPHTDLGYLHALNRWISNVADHLKPERLMMHSKNYHEVNGELYAAGMQDQVTVYDPSEWRDAVNFADPELQHFSDLGGTTDLRTFLNTKIGCKIPTNSTQVEFYREPEKQIDIMEAILLVDDNVLSPRNALAKLDLSSLDGWLRSKVDTGPLKGTGYEYNASDFNTATGNSIVGKVAFTEADIQELRSRGHKPVLVLNEFEPAQTKVVQSADGLALLGKGSEHLIVVTANHGMTAVMGVNSYTRLTLTHTNGEAVLRYDHPFKPEITFDLKKGDDVTLVATPMMTGEGTPIFKGNLYNMALPIEEWDATKDYYLPAVLGWADELRHNTPTILVKANADTPAQVRKSIDLGADGIGLLRTEHMFFAAGRLNVLQSALLTDDVTECETAFVKLKDFQKADFKEILSAAATTEKSFPVTIRLLDAPPEEFMNAEQAQIFMQKVGPENTRGVQLAERIPGLYTMQAEAIFEAAKETEFKGQLDVMIPLVRTVEEFRAAKREVTAAAEKTGMAGKYQIRAMIETLDAVKNAGEIAQEADGLSFGTNDLTSESMGGVARNDIVATREWMARLDVNHIGKSPFLRLSEPVKHLMEETVTKARAAKPGIDIGICGHQVAGEPDSIEFCHKLRLNSISVPASPQYLLASRIIAGQAAVNACVVS